MRERVRTILTWILSAVVVVILVAVIGEWFIEVAKDKGLYDNAGRNWDLLMGAVTAFVTSGVVLYPLVGLAGIVGGMWLDALLKRRAPPSDISVGGDVALHKVAVVQRVAVPPELTPERLLNIFSSGETDFQSAEQVSRYYGQWITVEGIVSGVSKVQLGPERFSPAISMELPTSQDNTAHVKLLFDNFDNIGRLQALRKGDVVKVFGCIWRVSPNYLSLEKCEFAV